MEYNSEIVSMLVSKYAQKVRAYRYANQYHQTKAGCAEAMDLSRNTVAKWWDLCEVTAEDKAKMDVVRRWMIDNHSDDCRKCSIDLNRPVEEVKADMMAIIEWFGDRIQNN